MTQQQHDANWHNRQCVQQSDIHVYVDKIHAAQLVILSDQM